MALVRRFVRADAAGGGDGTTNAASGANGAFTPAEAVTYSTTNTGVEFVPVQAGGTITMNATSLTFSGVGTTTAPNHWRGSNSGSTVGDCEANPTLAKPKFLFTTGQFLVTGAHQVFSNIEIEGASVVAGNSGGVLNFAAAATVIKWESCIVNNTAANANGRAMVQQSGSTVTFDRSYFGATTTATRAVELKQAVFDGNTVVGGIDAVGVGNNTCELSNNTIRGAAGHGITTMATFSATTMLIAAYNTIEGCGGDGIRFAHLPTSGVCKVANNLIANITGTGVINSTGTNTNNVHRYGNAFWNCGTTESGFGDSPYFDRVLEVATPFVNSAAGDLTLVSGSLSVGTAKPGRFTGASYTSYRDRGAVQRQATSAAPNATDLRSGVVVGSVTGTLTLPTEGQVESGIDYGGGGTEFTGSLVTTGITETELATALAPILGKTNQLTFVSGRVDSYMGDYNAALAPADDGVVLATDQPNYAPSKTGDAMTLTVPAVTSIRTELDTNSSKLANLNATVSSRAVAGDAMSLTSTERLNTANVVEAQIIDETDAEKVLTAITNKIASVNPDLGGLTTGAISAAVWTYATRVLTSGLNIVLAKGTGLTGLNDLSAAQVNSEADIALADAGVSGSVMGRLDQPISTRAPADTALSTAQWTNAKAVFLDASVAGRAPASTALSNATWSDAKAAFLDGSILSRAPASTALSNTTWTNAKAGFIDASIASVSTGGLTVEDIADAVAEHATIAGLDTKVTAIGLDTAGTATTVAARLDVAVSTRAPASTALSSATWTNAKAAFLDASISSVSTGGVSAGDIADAVTGHAVITGLHTKVDTVSGHTSAIAGTVATNLDASVSSRAPAATALSNATWTNAKAAFVDASIASRAPAATALSTVEWTNTRASYLDASIAGIGLAIPSADAVATAVGAHASITGLNTKADTINTKATAIQAKTDIIPAQPAAVGSAMTMTGNALAAAMDGMDDVLPVGAPTGFRKKLLWVYHRLAHSAKTTADSKIRVKNAAGQTLTTQGYTESSAGASVGNFE
jgi:hypothetical protein